MQHSHRAEQVSQEQARECSSSPATIAEEDTREEEEKEGEEEEGERRERVRSLVTLTLDSLLDASPLSMPKEKVTLE